MLHRKIEGGYIIGDEYGQVKQILIVRPFASTKPNSCGTLVLLHYHLGEE